MTEQLIYEAGLKALLPWVDLIVTLCIIYACICIVLNIIKKVHEILFGEENINEENYSMNSKLIYKMLNIKTPTVNNNGETGKSQDKKQEDEIKS